MIDNYEKIESNVKRSKLSISDKLQIIKDILKTNNNSYVERLHHVNEKTV